jgi:hypothetical protein
MIPTEINEKVHTINIPEFDKFKEIAKTEPMCKDWKVVDIVAGWTTVSVPNWNAGIPAFYKMIEIPV